MRTGLGNTLNHTHTRTAQLHYVHHVLLFVQSDPIVSPTSGIIIHTFKCKKYIMLFFPYSTLTFSYFFWLVWLLSFNCTLIVNCCNTALKSPLRNDGILIKIASSKLMNQIKWHFLIFFFILWGKIAIQLCQKVKVHILCLVLDYWFLFKWAFRFSIKILLHCDCCILANITQEKYYF